MQIQKTILLLIFSFGFTQLKAQELDLYFVNIKGVVTSVENGEPVVYAHIINPKDHTGTTSNADGFFSINMLTDDTLIIRSIGFIDYHFILKEFPPKEKYNIVLTPAIYRLNEVIVTEKFNMRKRLGLPDAGTLDIPIEMRGNDYNEKPSILSAFFNPISFLNYHLNDKEKSKRETLIAIKNNKEWLQFSTYFNLETIQRLTGLNDNYADEFLIYCNLNNRLPYYASQMQIEFQIIDLFFKFKKEKAQNIGNANQPDETKGN